MCSRLKDLIHLNGFQIFPSTVQIAIKNKNVLCKHSFLKLKWKKQWESHLTY